MKYTLLSACFFCVVNATAQNDGANRLDIGMEFTTELQATNNGDFNNANLLRLDASLSVSRNISIDAATISTYMTASESIGCDLQGFSNIDAENIPFALSKCNVAWQLNEHQSIYVGIRNMNEDYFTSPVTSFFSNSSCGIYPTISANYPIANYPVASVGVHYSYDGGPIKVQASLYNGTGYKRFTGRDNVFRFCPQEDGVFALSQIEYQHKGSQYFLGTSVYFSDNRMRSTLWAYAEQSLMPNLSMLAAYGHAFHPESICRDFCGAGMKYAARHLDLGIFSDYTRIDSISEWATELTCNIPCTAYFSLQPTIHIITTDTNTQCVGMLRLTVSL